MQPRAERVASAERAGPPQEHQECRLEGVLDVARFIQEPAADPEDHRTVERHQCLERGLIAKGGEPT